MGNANRRRIFAVVLGFILTFGVVGGGFGASAIATAGDGPAAASDDAPVLGQDDGTENETDDRAAKPIPITEAMEAARAETEGRNGTVVGAELGQRDGLLEFDAASVYTVDALLANGTHVEVAVNATNGSVVDTEAQDEGFLEGIFGEDEVPQRPLDLSATYNATEAVELAQNETDENETVTSVSLEQRDDALVYEVQMEGGDGNQTTVIVDATKDGQGVIEVNTVRTGGDGTTDDGTASDDSGEETDAGAGNETGDGGEGGADGGNGTGDGDGT